MLFSSAIVPSVVIGIWGLMILMIIISAIVLCCDKEFRARLRGDIPPQDIEAGRPSPSNAATEAGAATERRRQPPDENQQASIPISAAGRTTTTTTIVVWLNRETDQSDRTDDSCAVCLEEFKDGDRCRVLSKCNHLFHQVCIDLWLVKALHCPLCRCSVHDLEPSTQN